MTKDDHTSETGLGRRTLLTSAIAGAGALVLPSRAKAAEAPVSELPLPSMTAQTTEGPYYLELDLNRADITEGLPGTPLDVVFTVLNEAGRPYEGAIVDIWHCDAQGRYSGFTMPGETPAANAKGTTFLRGTQRANADGEVTFHSIYPGWYRGRTTHIHFKVRNGGLTNLTSQFFLPDTLSEFLYTQVGAYRRDALRDTLNSDDGIAIEAGETVEGSVRERQGRYVAALMVRVDRAANPPVDRPPAPGEGGRPFGPPPGGAGGPPLPKALQGQERITALLPNAKRVRRSMPPDGPRRP